MTELECRIVDRDKFSVEQPEERSVEPGEEHLLEPERFPRMNNISVGFFARAVVRPAGPRLPTEYIYVPAESARKLYPLSMWNLNWESAQVRGRLRGLVMSLPKELRPIVKLRDDINVTFVPREPGHRYQAYAPLYHLLPRRTVERHGLPLIPSGVWPSMFVSERRVIPSDFDDRLARAFAAHIWPHLCSGSRLDAFSKDDPLKLLAHSLDFWLGPVTELVQDWMSQFGRARADRAEARLIATARNELEPGLLVNRPMRGGQLWSGEEQAHQVVQALVERADAQGRLRGILDAVRQNRVEEDFSARWSPAREDFERKLYRKRNKIKVKFVELTDTIPVHGPESEVEGKLLYENFIALLDTREREVLVLLRSGVTKLGDIASRLGYANHSPVSKRLQRIRQKAAAFFRDA